MIGQSPSVSFPVLLAVHTESLNLRNYRRKRLCCFLRATPSSSLHAVVTVRFGAVPLDEGRVQCHGRCAPRPFIAPASVFFFLNLHIFLLLYDEFVGGALALAPCFMVLCLVCRLRFFHAMLKRLVRCLPFFCAQQSALFGYGGSSEALRLRARRTCRISRCCSLAVLVGE
ncbi:hypothetical protein TcCL_ESM07291 [Trypanosoma cruzi]|nr:hypothetical protein TcCL_Unassigned01644 [Trypanosoma cruzi]RNC55243.1 hypothetical protein TcCL_ESM07291 [Trypanosoma cruzi]